MVTSRPWVSLGLPVHITSAICPNNEQNSQIKSFQTPFVGNSRQQKLKDSTVSTFPKGSRWAAGSSMVWEFGENLGAQSSSSPGLIPVRNKNIRGTIRERGYIDQARRPFQLPLIYRGFREQIPERLCPLLQSPGYLGSKQVSQNLQRAAPDPRIRPSEWGSG